MIRKSRGASTPKVAKVANAPFTQRGVCLRLRQRSPRVDLLLDIADGFRDHKTGLYAALLSHFGFLSVFPLLAALTTVLGYVLEDNPKLRTSIVDSALSNVPIIGEQIRKNPGGISGSLVVLILGLATSLWAGTKAFVAAQTAMNEIWEVPTLERPNLVNSRLRALLGIGTVGLSQIGTGVLTGLVGVSGVSWVNRVLLTVAALAVNTLSLMGTYRVLTARRLNRRQLLPGAVFAGIAFVILQILTSTIVARALKNAAPVYGNLSGVIALFGWLSLHATASLVGVEINAAVSRRRTRAGSISNPWPPPIGAVPGVAPSA